MSLAEYCTESEKQNGCLGAEWLLVYLLFTLVSTWLTGSCSSHCPASPEKAVLCSPSQGESKIQNSRTVSTEDTLLPHHLKSQKIRGQGDPVVAQW